MRQITIKRENGVIGWGPIKFDTQELAQVWIDAQIACNSWGLPGEYTVINEAYSIPWNEERQKRYAKEADPLFKEAVREKLEGNDVKWLAYMIIVDGIKTEFPKT